MNSNNLFSYLWDYKIFLDKIFEELKEDKIDVWNYQLDHICYRVSTSERYNIIKNELLIKWEFLSENIVSGRKIATYKLFTPIVYKNREIFVIEIPSPKQWSDYQEWFEHVEFVIDKSFSEFIKMYPNVNFSTKAINKKINPEIKVWYKNGSVKFHHYSLEYVIKHFE